MRTRTWQAIGAGAVLLLACEPYGPSRVAHGQLYTAGQPTYDEYFRNVHQQQVDAAGWQDDRKSAHRPLVGALDLTPDAADVTLVQATHEAASKSAKQAGSVRLDVDGTSAHVVSTGGASDGGALFRAIEDTAHAELERAKRMHAIEPKIDQLAKQGSDLQGHVKDDFKTRGINKENEVTSELSSSVSVLRDLKARADREARASEDFVADLERALETASEERAAKQRDKEKKKAPPPKKEKERDTNEAPKPAAAPKPAPQPEAPKPEPSKPPPPKPADTGEVFTP